MLSVQGPPISASGVHTERVPPKRVARRRAVGRVMAALTLALAVAGVVSSTAGAEPRAASPAVEGDGAAAPAAPFTQSCGPCPSVVFALGSGTGTIELWHIWKSGAPTSKDDECTPAVRGQCIFYVEEGITSQEAYLVARPGPGTDFAGWRGSCSRVDSVRCYIQPGSILSACAVFKLGSENVDPTCPPPSLQLYKKGVTTVPGTTGGSVTVTGQLGRTDTCGVSCPSSVQTSWATGDTLTLRATPASGFEFVRWDGCPTAPQPDGTCRFVLQKSEVVCSVFVQAGSPPPADPACPYLTPPVVKNPEPKAATPPKLGSRCTIRGSSRADVIQGTPRNDVICGLGGNDVIYGKGGHDLLVGGGGNDRLYGQAGNDRIVGGAGKDGLYGGGGADLLHARDRLRDVVNGGRGGDGASADRVDVRRSIERRF